MNSVGVEEIHQFFADWRQLRQEQSPESQLGRWQQFFSKWRNLTFTAPIEEKSTKFDCEQFEKFVCAFAKPYDEYRRSGAFMNIWQITGLGKDEVKNSAVLSWMLDRNADHGQGSVILERLIELVDSLKDVGIKPETIRENYYRIKTESLPLDERHSRVDIEIESSVFLIFIEVKISAPESNDQLRRYFDLIQQKAAGRPWLIIFLTPDGRKAKDIFLHEHLISISWRHISGIFLKHVKNSASNSFANQAMKQYASHVLSFI